MAERALKHRVVIVGGGFGGIRAALDLAKHADEFDITLVSDKPHFEYHAALYRVVTGRSPLEVCIPLSEIFENSPVKLVEDTIKTVYPKTKQLIGESTSRYWYDSLILALGSETNYFGVPGLKEYSLGMKSINEALRFKRHLHELFTKAAAQIKDGQKGAIHIVVVGGGATGVELSGELVVYTRQLAERHQISPNAVIIELFEAGDRLVPMLDKNVSQLVYNRLHRLGVNIFLDTPIVEKRLEAVYLNEMKVQTKTVVWTAGVSTNHLYKTVKGLSLDKHGRVLVDLSMQAKGINDLYVIGDAAATRYSGMAQTALYDGLCVAENIRRRQHGIRELAYRPAVPKTAIPIGHGWAIFVSGRTVILGRLGWWLRRWVDLKFYLSILPMSKALLVFMDGYKLSETCPICSKEKV